MNFSFRHAAFIVFALCLACPSVNDASSITITGDTAASTEKLGNFTAGLIYNYVAGATTATLTIRMTNTSPLENGGYITGFAFSTPDNSLIDITLNEGTNAAFTLLGSPSFRYSISASPFGDFGIGVALGGNFLGGGSPRSGISVGETADFFLSITGDNLAQLSASSFTGTNSEGYFSVVRFRGFNDGRSDKVPGRVTDVPEPNVVALLVVGLLCLVTFNRTYVVEKVSPLLRNRNFFPLR